MPKKKKILHFITGLETGGSEAMLLKTLPKMQNDFDSRVCTLLQDGPVGRRLRDAGIKTYHLNFSALSSVKSIIKFKKIINEFNPDILVTYLIHADLFGRVFGRLFGIKIIISNQRGKLLQWEFLRLADRMTSFLVTSYIVQTDTAKHELTNILHLPKNKIAVIPNGVDIREYDIEIDTHAKRQDLNVSTTDTVIVCVSNLRRGKGIEYLLQAFESVNMPGLKLLIVGDGEEREKLHAQTINYTSKPNILFLGHRNDVKEILKISDIFILPTLGEGMSNAILEAMASGLPVITTNIPENEAWLSSGKNALLVQPQSSGAIHDAIIKVIQDPPAYSSLGGNAKQLVINNFSLDSTISRWQAYLSSQ